MPRRNRPHRRSSRPATESTPQDDLTTDQMAWRLVREGKAHPAVLGPTRHSILREGADE